MSEAEDVHTELSRLTAWFCENVPYAAEGCYLNHHAEIARRSLADVLSDLRAGRAGVRCGGMALFMKLRAEELGHAAFAMNFGRRDGPESHVIVVARLAADRYGFYDPTFGAFICDRFGQPANVTDIICALRARDVGALKCVRLGSRRKPYFFDPNKFDSFLQTYPGLVPQMSANRTTIEISVDDLASHSFGPIESWLKTRINEPLEFDLLRFPIGTSGETEVEMLANQLAKIGHDK